MLLQLLLGPGRELADVATKGLGLLGEGGRAALALLARGTGLLLRYVLVLQWIFTQFFVCSTVLISFEMCLFCNAVSAAAKSGYS